MAMIASSLSGMKIAIIGTGKMGRGFATALFPKHKVVLGSRDPARAAKVVRATGAEGAATYEEAASAAEVIILAVPWKAIEDVLPSLGNLGGKVVVDITVPLRQRDRGPWHTIERRGGSKEASRRSGCEGMEPCLREVPHRSGGSRSQEFGTTGGRRHTSQEGRF